MEVAADAVGHTTHMEVRRGIARRTAPIHFGPSTPVGKPRHRAADRLATRSGWLGVLFYIHRTDDWATLDAPSTLAQLGHRIDCRCCGGRRLRGVKPGMRSITDQIQPRAVHDSARSFSCMCTKLAPEPCLECGSDRCLESPHNAPSGPRRRASAISRRPHCAGDGNRRAGSWPLMTCMFQSYRFVTCMPVTKCCSVSVSQITPCALPQ